MAGENMTDEMTKQRARDIHLATEAAKAFIPPHSQLNPEQLAENKQKLETFISNVSPNYKAIEGTQQKIDYKQYVAGIALGNHRSNELRKNRWNDINAALENPDKDPKKAYQIEARKAMNLGQRGTDLDKRAGEAMLKDGYSLGDIQKSIETASPYAVGKAKEHGLETMAKIKKDPELKKLITKSNSKQLER